MLRIAILNNSHDYDVSLIFSLVRYNMEYQTKNRITIFSSAKALQNAVNSGNEYDLFFIYPDYDEDKMSKIAVNLAENYIAGLPETADYNSNGEVSVRDAAAIARALAVK